MPCTSCRKYIINERRKTLSGKTGKIFYTNFSSIFFIIRTLSAVFDKINIPLRRSA